MCIPDVLMLGSCFGQNVPRVHDHVCTVVLRARDLLRGRICSCHVRGSPPRFASISGQNYRRDAERQRGKSKTFNSVFPRLRQFLPPLHLQLFGHHRSLNPAYPQRHPLGIHRRMMRVIQLPQEGFHFGSNSVALGSRPTPGRGN
jgi:hypothetical protein